LHSSITILLPIHNAQHRLERHVAEILDVLPELTNRFEVMIIDDGSTDDSFELARNLAIKFPQVSTLRHPRRLGLAQAVQSGLAQTDGDLVLVGDEQQGVRADDLRRLWHRFTQQDGAQNSNQEPTPEAPVSSGRARWFEKILGWRPDRRLAPTPPQMAGHAEGSERRHAAAIVRGIKRRVDERENVASRRADVHPLHLNQRTLMAGEAEPERQPPGTGPTARGPGQRGPNDRRRSS
jgi:hypothetical protein